jgi:uncharacterized protein YbjT (DUF2867 family)
MEGSELRMILITGAAGKTGQAVIRALVARDQPVRALVRNAAQSRRLISLGVQEILTGDLREADTIQEATRGAWAVYHICPNLSEAEIPIGQAVIKAARVSGVEHLVYHSVLHPQTEAMPHHWLKLAVEAAMFESGLSFTILQPAAYMQNVLAGWEEIVEHGIYTVPYAAETRLGMVDLEDVAEAAARVLTTPGHAGAIYELAGSQVLTQTEIAALLSRVLDRPVQARQIPLEEWTLQAGRAGLGDYQINTLLKMFSYYEQYGFWGNPRMLTALLGHAPARFEDFIQRTIQETTD